jgi:L-ascorbate metabolism protein UlaG (beta-lactamase superfamily)
MRRHTVRLGFLSLACCLASTQADTRAQSSLLVRITPLGSHAGELCVFDRAMLMEDPTGIRILYDPGRTVDENDPRLGDVHAMLLSHVHSDHIGDLRPARGGGTCAAPANSGASPNSNFAAIAAAKRAAVIVAPDVTAFLNSRIQNVRGTPTPGCPTSGPDNETVVPTPTVCTAGLNYGSTRMLTRAGAGSVRVAVVPAVHTNAIPAQYLDPPALPTGVAASAGPPVGFVVLFSNGLRVYLGGDTGVTNEMDMIAKLYRPNLAIINLNDINTMGPAEAAFAMQQYIRPVTVMPSHVNEQSTSGGVEIAGTRAERFARQARGFADVVISVSDVTRSFDGEGRCVGCR